jgi:hypothetical protein
MNSSVPCGALELGKRLQLVYDGLTRVVEVHVVGTSKDGNWIMRVWQVRGGSLHNEPTDWKVLRLDKCSGAQLIDEKSEAPREGYKRRDPAMTGSIKSQL